MAAPLDSTQPFPFLRLPLDIRYIVYELVYTPPNYQVDLTNPPAPDLAPLLLSRQVRRVHTSVWEYFAAYHIRF